MNATTESTGTCPTCGTPATFRAYTVLGVTLDPICSCAECERNVGQWWRRKTSAESKRQAEIIRERRLSEWQRACPTGYAPESYNPERIGDATLRAIPNRYQPGESLGMVGTSRAGKTRTAYLCLRAAYDAGHSVAAISHVDLVKLARDASLDLPGALDEVERLKTVGTMLLDDLGKGRDTRTGNETLQALVEARIANRRAIIWTANGGRKYLVEKLGDEFGLPIVGRLGEMEVVVV